MNAQLENRDYPAPLYLEGFTAFPAEFADRYRKLGYWRGTTHSEMLFESIGRGPENIALIQGDRRLTYAQLGSRVLRLAAGFSGLGISRGDRVVVHLPNCIEYFEVIFALFELGAVPVFALAAHRETEIRYFCEKSGAKAYVTVDEYEGYDHRKLADLMLEEVETVEHAIVVPAHPDPASDYESLFGDALAHARRCHPSDVAFLQLSGGTTGKPKLIPRTHDDYLYTIRESARICDLRRSSVHLVVLPVSHNYTMSSPGVLGCLHVGATIVLADNGSPDIAFPLIEKHAVTSASLVPTIALMWMNSSIKERHDLSSLELVQVGGAKLSREAALRVGPELGCRLQQVFGMAEGLVNYTRLDDDEETIASTQGLRISPDDEVAIVDELGRVLPTGEAGHLLTRGPYTIRGYYDAPDGNAASFTEEGFYRTGDIAFEDERGYLVVTGRAKDQINRGGEKISPEEIENLLLSHPLIHDASVVGVPDEALGEKVKAFVMVREGADVRSLSAFKLKRFLRGKGIAEFKIPEAYELVEEFPETKVGKVSKRDQREDS